MLDMIEVELVEEYCDEPVPELLNMELSDVFFMALMVDQLLEL